jgi:hypothetical protein
MPKPLVAILAVVLALSIQACAPKYKAQDDCHFVQNVYGERISWKKNVPVTLFVHSSFPAKYMGAIESAMKDWEDRIGHPLFKLGGTTGGPLEPRQDGASVIYWMSAWEADRASEQARTSVYWVGDEIREADIRINDKNFDFFWNDESSSGKVHIESLLIHELGHVLGLKHNDTSPSVMGTFLASGTKRDKIPDGDMDALKCEY